MAKQIFVVRPHSVVDLITNSSSELFVYSGPKSAAVVEDFIRELIDLNNRFSDHKVTFEDAFREIYVSTETRKRGDSSDDGYGIETKPGDVIIESRSDNTIPWALQQAIEDMLGATRYHLG